MADRAFSLQMRGIMTGQRGEIRMLGIYVVVLLLALIALLPETDGFSDEGCID
jgi:hypothetical protein